MSLLQHALRAGQAATTPAPHAKRRVLVAGGAGALGSAVLEQLLASGAFLQVTVLVEQPLNVALRGLVTVPLAALDQPLVTAEAEDTAIVVFDRMRHANGREQAFARPKPEALPALAAGLHRRGVRRLVVVVPHAAASLPQGLRQGLANLDEHAVASLGFEHLVFIRSAQASQAQSDEGAMQRLGHWVLAHLQLMIPQRDKPVRPAKIAQFAAQLAAELPQAPEGTRVVPPEIVWEAAQTRDVQALARDWLHGRHTPDTTPQRMRM